MFYELSKREKKSARACIDKGLDAAFRKGLEKSAGVISEWQQGKFNSNKEAYHQLYKELTGTDDAIGRRYDGLSGSGWLMTVARLFSEGVITEDDIQEFSDTTKAMIRHWSKQ